MDSSISIKRPPPASKGLAVRDPVTVREAAATDLDRSKTVNTAGDADARHDNHRQERQHQPDQHPDHSDHAPQDLLANPESRELIYRERDVRGPDRVHQDQALLRQRAYAPAPAKPAEGVGPLHDPIADLKA